MSTPAKRLNFFERYLSVWVLVCMVVGLALGKMLPAAVTALSRLEFGTGSQVNVPIAVLIWLMIYPMMLRIDFSALAGVTRRPRGLLVTLFVNWLVKPFSMAFLGWLFFRHVFAAWVDPQTAGDYTAGLIILAAAPCTAMVFVWSYLTDGDPAYTLVQVAVNDLIMLVAFAPIVMFLCGVANVIDARAGHKIKADPFAPALRHDVTGLSVHVQRPDFVDAGTEPRHLLALLQELDDFTVHDPSFCWNIRSAM